MVLEGAGSGAWITGCPLATNAPGAVSYTHLDVYKRQSVIHLARTIGPDALRSLDAIHLATAVAVGADVMFTYDARLAEAARDWGLARCV